MANVATILSEIKTLPQYQQEELLSHLEEYLVLGAQVGQVTKEVKEFRFFKGRHFKNTYIHLTLKVESLYHILLSNI